MWLGLASVLCSFVTGIPAIILGILALPKASAAAKPKAFVGMGAGGLMTVVGLVVGIAKPGEKAQVATPADAGADAAPVTVVTCRGTGEKRPNKCRGPECAGVGTEVLCFDRYLDLRGKKVNNWIKDKQWETYKARVALVSFSALEADKEHRCAVGSAEARVHICRKDGQITTAPFTGLVTLDAYTENLLVDDLETHVLQAPGDIEQGFAEALELHELLERSESSSEATVKALDKLDKPRSEGGRRAMRETIVAMGLDIGELRAKADAARAKVAGEVEERKKKDRERLETDPFERMLAVSEPLSAIDDDDWAVPPRGACGTEPSGDVHERRREEARRPEILRGLQRRLFHVSASAEKIGEFDYATKTVKVAVTASDFALSGFARTKSEPLKAETCCNVITGACRPPDGLIFTECKRVAEEMRETVIGSSTSIDDGSKRTTLSIPLSADDDQRVGKSAWTAEVVVSVTNATRICSTGEKDKTVESKLLGGRIVGLRISAGGEVVHRKADVKVTVEQAQGGASEWAKLK